MVDFEKERSALQIRLGLKRQTTGAVHGGMTIGGDMCLMKEIFEKKKDGLKKRNFLFFEKKRLKLKNVFLKLNSG
jgi:hypothetical protein